MINIDDYKEIRSCIYRGEEYLVRDNGAVLRKARPNKKLRKYDEVWTFGKPNIKTGYLEIASKRVHQIVATAFHGADITKKLVVDHIDTNKHNNRPSNLRWTTRLENVLCNENTRKKIEYITGVSIYEFLENPAKYRDMFPEQNFAWMRTVTEEEAKACLENLKKLGKRSNIHEESSNRKIGEWIYRRFPDSNDSMKNGNYIDEYDDITDSLTLTAKQKNWRTPTEFLCCPIEIKDEPIKSYFNNLKEGKIFSKTKYGESKVVKYALVNDNEILTINEISESIKPFALARVTYEYGYYIHESLGMFFSDEGAEKQFVLAQGLEWNGENSIDDYC